MLNKTDLQSEIKLLFLVSLIDNVDHNISAEAKIYQGIHTHTYTHTHTHNTHTHTHRIADILLVNAQESYDKLPYKTAALYAFVVLHCPLVKWILATDSDMIIDFEVFQVDFEILKFRFDSLEIKFRSLKFFS